MRQFALLLSAFLSMQLDLRAVGGFCRDAIAAIFFRRPLCAPEVGLAICFFLFAWGPSARLL